MNNFTIEYEVEDEPSEIYTWTQPSADISDALYNFYRSDGEFNYSTPVIINIKELK